MALLGSLLPPVVSLTALGVFFGAVLGIASRIFAVEADLRVDQIVSCLPGGNCGGCGYPGCSAFAEAVAAGRAPTNGCVVGGNPVACELARIMGTEALAVQRRAAVVKCAGSSQRAAQKYDYVGYADCGAQHALLGGAKQCPYACCGLGTCVRACPFGAISVVDGVAVVDRERCTACGACVAACPMGIIQLAPYDCDHEVICSNPLPAKEVRDVCSVGCIGCGLCVRSCAVGAIHMEGHLAVIDHARCVNCHVCVDRCPRGIIRYLGDRPTVVQPAEACAADGVASRA